MKTGVVLCVAVSTVLTTAAMSEPLGVSSKPPPGATVRRVLSFEERVAAQQAIDKVYYAHTVGRTKSFDEVEPRSVAESKVRKYLAQSAALAVYWNTPVTDEMLERELERMATRSRMPERLTELYAALRYDTVLVKECLARPVVVDRLTRNFYAFDRRFHAPVRRQADELRERLTSGRVDPAGEYSARREFVLCLSDSGGTLARPNRQAWFDLASPAPFRTELNREEYGRRRARLPRAVGEVSPVEETADAFTITVLLSESPKEVRAATYTVPKTPWDTWWASVEPGLDSEPVSAVASDGTPPPSPDVLMSPADRLASSPDSDAACPGDDTWVNGILDEVPDPRDGHTAVWTGSVMVVWGGERSPQSSRTLDTGARYDPATDTWAPTTTVGAPSRRLGHTAIWTGTEMIVWGGYDGFGHVLQDGDRYDPVADTWSPTSTQSVPAPRYLHTAVWTGSQMIVWGGSISIAV